MKAQALKCLALMLLLSVAAFAAIQSVAAQSFTERCNAFDTGKWSYYYNPPVASDGTWVFQVDVGQNKNVQANFKTMTGYGTYEIVLKIDGSRAAGVTWCVFLYDNQGDYQPGQDELDFAEVWGNHAVGEYSLSMWVDGKSSTMNIGYWYLNAIDKAGINFEDGAYHTFTYVYSESDLLISLDGVQIYQWPVDCTNKTALGLPAPPMQFMIGCGTRNGAPAAQGFKMTVDSITYTEPSAPVLKDSKIHKLVLPFVAYTPAVGDITLHNGITFYNGSITLGSDLSINSLSVDSGNITINTDPPSYILNLPYSYDSVTNNTAIQKLASTTLFCYFAPIDSFYIYSVNDGYLWQAPTYNNGELKVYLNSLANQTQTSITESGYNVTSVKKGLTALSAIPVNSTAEGYYTANNLLYVNANHTSYETLAITFDLSSATAASVSGIWGPIYLALLVFAFIFLLLACLPIESGLWQIILSLIGVIFWIFVIAGSYGIVTDYNSTTGVYATLRYIPLIQLGYVGFIINALIFMYRIFDLLRVSFRNVKEKKDSELGLGDS